MESKMIEQISLRLSRINRLLRAPRIINLINEIANGLRSGTYNDVGSFKFQMANEYLNNMERAKFFKRTRGNLLKTFEDGRVSVQEDIIDELPRLVASVINKYKWFRVFMINHAVFPTRILEEKDADGEYVYHERSLGRDYRAEKIVRRILIPNTEDGEVVYGETVVTDEQCLKVMKKFDAKVIRCDKYPFQLRVGFGGRDPVNLFDEAFDFKVLKVSEFVNSYSNIKS